MKLTFKEAALAAVVVAVLGIAALVLGWPFIDGEALFGKDSKLVGAAQVVGAIGTVATAIAAVWLARASDRRSDAITERLAKARAHRQLLALHSLAHIVGVHCRNIEPGTPASAVRAEFILIEALARRLERFDDRFLADLAPFGDRLVRDLAHAFSQIELCAVEASDVLMWSRAAGQFEQAFAERRIGERSHGMCMLFLNHAYALLEAVVEEIGAKVNTDPPSIRLEDLKPLRKAVLTTGEGVDVNPSPPTAG